ncbi:MULTISPECIES: YheC/YheD family protein [Bacillus]|uniref:YheC/YheD family protein n=1 Tax=Bacillus TaxID=1386 RepID=UPI000BB80646|nr:MULTISPECIES: YheC/YheD family protein [Bacillus]
MKVTIYYDWQSQTWVQVEKDLPSLSFGEREDITVVSRRKKTFLPFTVSVANGNIVGPVVGIMVNKSEGQSFSGNIKLLERLQKELFRIGGFSVVVTEEFFENNFTQQGYCYHPQYEKWVKLKVPPLQVLYNRMYKEGNISKVMEWCKEKDITFFNLNYFDKFSTFLCLRENQHLLPYLPSTSLLTEQNFYELLSTYKSVYIKKRLSAKGKGIFSLSLYGSTIILKTISKTIMFPTMEKAFNFLQKELKLDEYIIQQTIETLKMDDRKFDLRILAHFINGKHEISGVGVRIACGQQVTTHVPNGGEIGYIQQLPIEINVDKLRKLISNVGADLSTYERSLIGEFSADIGVRSDGSFCLFEINAKPMDFDEVDIKKAGTENLIKVFYDNAKFFKKESSLVKAKHITN